MQTLHSSAIRSKKERRKPKEEDTQLRQLIRLIKKIITNLEINCSLWFTEPDHFQFCSGTPPTTNSLFLPSCTGGCDSDSDPADDYVMVTE